MSTRKFVPNNRLGDVKPLVSAPQPIVRGKIATKQQPEPQRQPVKAHWEGTATATGEFAHASGNSTASGDYSTATGFNTTASGTASFAAGSGATAANNNSFVWSDGTSVTSTAIKQFIVQATGGVSLTTGGGAQTVVNNGAAGVAVQTATQTIGSNTTWTYVPGVPGNWTVVPANVADALDELASMLVTEKDSCLYSASTNSTLCITDASLVAILNLNTEMTLFANGGLQVGGGTATGANSFATGTGTATGATSQAGGADSVAFDSGSWARGTTKFTNAGDAQVTKHVLKKSQTGAGTFNIEDTVNTLFATIPPSTAFVATINLVGVDDTSFDNYGLTQTVRGYNTSGNVLTVNNIVANATGQGTLASATVAVSFGSSGTTSSRSRFTTTVTTSSGSLGSHVTRWVANIEITHVGTV